MCEMCVWLPDADGIEMDSNALNILFSNNAIKSYLIRQSKIYGISGVKGQGKTFLIKAKRKTIQDTEDNSIICLPRDRMVSILDSSIVISSTTYKYLEDFSNWVSLWKASLVITLMQDKECKSYFKNINFDDFGKAKDILLKLISCENRTSSITQVFNNILVLDKREINLITRNTNKLILYLDRITNGIYIFIDKIDQAFSIDMYPSFGTSKSSSGPRNASFWQYAQFSLACMSYDINNINNHIKVYYTIRDEALIDAEKLAPNIFRNVTSYIMNIKYDKKELKEMFLMYIKAEENYLLKDKKFVDSNPPKAFVGFDKIEHIHIKKSENIFDYIYRHSMKRPSDNLNKK